MTVSPANSGVVKVDGVVYTGNCGYSQGAVARLEAVAATQYRFDRWGGSLTGSVNPTTIKMDSDKNVTAYFVLKTKAVSLEEAKNLLDANRDVLVIDIGTAEDFAAGHLLCAKNHAWNGSTFSPGTGGLSAYKNINVLLYSRTGANTKSAADNLAAQGFTSVKYLTDGLDDWMAEGYETFTTAGDGAVCTSTGPLAYAGNDQTVNENQTVTLNGSGSSAGVSYAWEQAEGASVALSNSSAQNPTFKAPDLDGPAANSILIFHLTVTDGGGNTDTDSVVVTVHWNNAPPTASAGPDQAVKYGDTVQLNGTGSTDPENHIVSYQWSASSGTINPALSGSTTATPTFTAPSKAGWVMYQLTVTDNGGLSHTDTVKITVAAGGSDPADVDDDGDGYTENQGDCNDANNKIHPGATETCGDGIDQDCNGSDLACSNTPAAPTNVKATDGTVSGKVQVTWNAVTGATSYDVYRANMPAWAGGVPTRIATSVTGTTYDDASAVGGNQYYYWVKAKNANGGSGYSMFDPGYWGAANVPPVAPVNAAATDGTVSGMVTVTWSAVPNALVYEIYRADYPAYLRGSNIKTIGTSTTTSYNDTTVVNGNQYYYWVKARNSWGVSGYSKFDAGYIGTSSPLLPAPTGVAASDGTVAGKVTLTWNAVSGALIYEVYRAAKPAYEGGVPTLLDTVKSPAVTYNDADVTCGLTFYYWVKSRNSWGGSEYSKFDTGFCAGP